MFEEITSVEQFEKVSGQEQPVVLTFHADWCPDWHRMDMFIEDVMSNFKEIASTNDVMGIPSLLVIQHHEKIGRLHSANAKTSAEVQAFLQKFFSYEFRCFTNHIKIGGNIL